MSLNILSSSSFITTWFSCKFVNHTGMQNLHTNNYHAIKHASCSWQRRCPNSHKLLKIMTKSCMFLCDMTCPVVLCHLNFFYFPIIQTGKVVTFPCVGCLLDNANNMPLIFFLVALSEVVLCNLTFLGLDLISLFNLTSLNIKWNIQVNLTFSKVHIYIIFATNSIAIEFNITLLMCVSWLLPKTVQLSP